jgi:hypothetical protein
MTSVQPSAILATRYSRALDIAVVVVVAGWDLAGAGGELLANLARYRIAAVQVAAWLVLAAVVTAGSVLLLRGRAGWRSGWAMAVLALLISTVVAAGCPRGHMLAADWGWGIAGWIAVLVLLRRPLIELVVFLGLEALATFAVLVHDGLDRESLAGFVTVLSASVVIQLAVALAARAVEIPARQAAFLAANQVAAREQRVISARVHAARQVRWMAVRETVAPLLQDLAAGRANPADQTVRRDCAIAAARLRRLFAESDDAPDPLIHELLACADVAERRGVAADLEAVGDIPVVPAGTRRVLTDMAITILAAAATRARITVTASTDALIVSFVADGPADAPLPVPGGEVAISHQRDDDVLWVEARWNVR